MSKGLADRITNVSDLRSLATNGLEVKEHVIDKHLQNESDITEGAIKVLKNWIAAQNNAVDELCEALRSVGKNMYITEVL